MEKLAEMIDYRPDAVVGIVRGGVIPARILCSKLDVKKMYCINVEKDGEERVVNTIIKDDLTGKNCLLVEDALETGKNLNTGKKYLESKNAQIKTACVYITPQTEVCPDFYLRKVDDIPGFPWE